jgi:hypothetical protein
MLVNKWSLRVKHVCEHVGIDCCQSCSRYFRARNASELKHVIGEKVALFSRWTHHNKINELLVVLVYALIRIRTTSVEHVHARQRKRLSTINIACNEIKCLEEYFHFKNDLVELDKEQKNQEQTAKHESSLATDILRSERLCEVRILWGVLPRFPAQHPTLHPGVPRARAQKSSEKTPETKKGSIFIRLCLALGILDIVEFAHLPILEIREHLSLQEQREERTVVFC